MKATLLILLISSLSFVILFFILGVMSKSGQAQGIIEGRLSKCSYKPNCVCSEQKEDVAHYISPINIAKNINVLTTLKNTVQDMGGNIQTESNHYFAATFSSNIFGFIDDLEIRIDSEQNKIHIRSASRVGHGDLGANKKRVELLKYLYKKTFREQ